MLVAAVTFFTADHRRGLIGTGPPVARLLAAKAAVAGAVAFVTGLVTAGVVIPVGLAMLRANQNPIQPITLETELRVITGYAALTAAAAVLALGLAALVRRASSPSDWPSRWSSCPTCWRPRAWRHGC